MKPVSHAELERLAREEYRRAFKRTPEPVVINVEPLIALHAPRSFVLGGIGYRAPPVSFPLGFRLLVAANALRDRQTTPKRIAPLIRRVVRPVTLLGRIVAAIRPCPFANADRETAERFCRWLIHAPDESPVIPSKEPVTQIDVMDGVMEFAHAFPALTGPDGWPLSYAHYLYGTRYLGRLAAREDLRHAAANRMSATHDRREWDSWFNDLTARAGWARG